MDPLKVHPGHDSVFTQHPHPAPVAIAQAWTLAPPVPGFFGFSLPRSRRVLYLLLAVFLMSLSDLAITLVWVTNIGLAESNPLARWVIAQGSPVLLSVWKLVTIVPAVCVFVALRHKPAAEFGAIVAFVVLSVVTLHWYGYHAGIDDLHAALPAFEAGVDPRWISLASD